MGGAGCGVTRHVMVAFFEPADGNQAEAAAVSQAAATPGGAAATATGAEPPASWLIRFRAGECLHSPALPVTANAI